MLVLALVASLLAPQERTVTPSREFAIRVKAKERAELKTLWVSRDGGRTWKPARDAGVTETWADWTNGDVRCTIQVPEEGMYDFYAQLAYNATNRMPEPQPGQALDPASGARIEVRSGAAGALDWKSPRPGDEFIGGNQVVFRWTGEKADLKPRSLHLYAQVAGQPWKVVASELDAGGQYHWLLPATAAPSKIRFRLAGLGVADREIAAPELEGTLAPGRSASGIMWDEPRGSVDWKGGQPVTLKWTSYGLEFRERSAELQYAVDTEPWTTITRGLEPGGQYSWVVPNRDTARLRLRVRALTRSGQEASAESDAVSVRVAQRPNVAQARALYDRARVLHAQQRLAEAQTKYEEALAAWSEFAEALNDLGKVHAEQKEPAKALEYFLRARKTCASHPTPYVNAARMEVQMGLHDDALADLKDAAHLGLEKDERTAVLAGETLWTIVREASLAKDWKRAREACELILTIRLASQPTREKARQQLDWIKAEAR